MRRAFHLVAVAAVSLAAAALVAADVPASEEFRPADSYPQLAGAVNDEDGYDWRFYDSQEDARSAYAHWSAVKAVRS